MAYGGTCLGRPSCSRVVPRVAFTACRSSWLGRARLHRSGLRVAKNPGGPWPLGRTESVRGVRPCSDGALGDEPDGMRRAVRQRCLTGSRAELPHGY